MEKLKTVIPSNLKRMISESSPNDLPCTCSSLLDFFHHLPLFHQLVTDLTDKETALCGKNKDAAFQSKQKGNISFSQGDYSTALSFYSQAIRVVPTGADDSGKSLLATLYLNRATVLHKMGLLQECLRDCNRTLVISPCYAKAWYRRGSANTTLGNYDNAASDFNIAIIMEPSLGGKRQIESELKFISDKHNEADSCLKNPNKKILEFPNDVDNIELRCVYTQAKGKGMVSSVDLPPSSLLHTEEPFAAVILKPCRETHCHFCFDELPADTVHCSSCSIPLYCSEQCQVKAGGHKYGTDLNVNKIIDVDLPSYLREYYSDIILCKPPNLSNEHNATEHRHECEEVNWPAVLPSDVVLAGRILVKSSDQQRQSGAVLNLELCDNYVHLTSESKVELHIKSVILLHCLRSTCTSRFQMDGGTTLSQCVMLLNQIKVNAMGIVRMKSLDVYEPVKQSMLSSLGDALTRNVEQVTVAHAVYRVGRLFNHSCQPNIHAYFLSRNLCIRSTKFVAAGDPLELSYGPQVGEWDRKARQQFLKDQFSFECQCHGCSDLNLSDLVLNAFRCIKPKCLGAVVESHAKKFLCISLKKKFHSEPHMQVNKFKSDDISEVAGCLFDPVSCSDQQFGPGYCLNCGSYCNIDVSTEILDKAYSYIKRLDDAITSNEIRAITLSDALRSLDVLRSALHAYNREIATVEDKVAQAFCLAGELESAVKHCKASIEILEKLYEVNDIVIGNELVKLTSIELSMGNSGAALENINRMDTIFSRYYGSHVDFIFPHLKSLKLQLQTSQLVLE